ncbi:hypothetical protein SO802_000690 [Lithocarpus litseifolius]|uniref:RNase H type-1 domain-containing protein n=1 Tax=Lithocarpus litseifolius TaxID=425828 RepID=A0AAW2DXH0_9ROSI
MDKLFIVAASKLSGPSSLVDKLLVRNKEDANGTLSQKIEFIGSLKLDTAKLQQKGWSNRLVQVDVCYSLWDILEQAHPFWTTWAVIGHAIVNSRTHEAGLGVVIRNSRGQVMVALSEKIKKPPSVVALELLAARRAAVSVFETGFQNSVFEGDSLAVVKSLQGSGMENSAVGHILKDTLSIVSLLQSFSFSHVNRQGNAVAHALAQRARLSFPLQVWMESVPPDLDAVILADLQPFV